MRLDPVAHEKDPDATKQYTADGSSWLGEGDTITAHEILIDDESATPVVVDTDAGGATHDDTSVTVWLSGGTVGTQARVTVRVTTVQGVVDDGSWTFYIRQQ